MTDIKKLLGSNIKSYRVSLGISQEKLAETANMAANYLGLLENGKKFPSSEMIERIAAAMGKDSADLFAITPIQQNWKETILSKINTVINDELEFITHKAAGEECQNDD
jgi:transcriptional regulator with XRE-family HTH domain